MKNCSDLRMKSKRVMIFHGYPRVNWHNYGKPQFWMGKLTTNVTKCQRVLFISCSFNHLKIPWNHCNITMKIPSTPINSWNKSRGYVEFPMKSITFFHGFTISMAIFNTYLTNYQRVWLPLWTLSVIFHEIKILTIYIYIYIHWP